MARQDIFTIIKSKYNIEKEFNKINTLFCTALVVYRNALDFKQIPFTIEDVINENYLLYWKQRGSNLSCQEMRENIGFDTKDYSKDNILKALEYYSNLIYYFELKYKNVNQILYQFYKEYYMLLQNIDILIEHLNYEKFIIAEEEKVLLIPKNPAATAVAEISSEETAFAILKYNHASIKGNLKEKRNLLNTIYLEYETILENPIENYKDFYNKATGLYNNLHIRHDNKTKKNNKNLVLNIDDETLEKWYDELYQ